MFIENAWYVAAWDREVGRQTMLRRTLLDIPVVLYRREDGAPVALEDRCCHRHAPLSKGKLRGDNVECPYHGLLYDPPGRCIRVPGQTAIPPGARVPGVSDRRTLSLDLDLDGRSGGRRPRPHRGLPLDRRSRLARPRGEARSRGQTTCCWSRTCSTSPISATSTRPRSAPMRSPRRR